MASDKTQYVVALIAEFANHFGLTTAQAVDAWSITSDLIQLLIDREHFTLPRAVEAVYKSDIYAALLRPRTGLYAQSSGYVYQYLDKELKKMLNIKPSQGEP